MAQISITLTPSLATTLELLGAYSDSPISLGSAATISTEVYELLRGPSGSALVYTAASAISGHLAVTLDAAGQVIAADPGTAAHGNTVIGVTVGAAAGGASVELATTGLVTHAGWSFTTGAPVFAGAAGQITQTPPVGLWQKVIGVARSPTSFVLHMQPAIFN